jgi:hypothetical protein
MSDQLAAGYAVTAAEPVSAEERAEARAQLQLPPNAMIAVRLMRPDLRKWDPTPVLGVRRALDGRAPIHLVLREAPSQCAAWARRVLGDDVTMLPATVEPREVRSTLAAADVLVNYSTIGESFGLALAEGMMCGLVPIVNATPRADNAQIELCENGVSGIVANGPQALADAFAFLVAHPPLMAALGAAARQSIIDRFSPPLVERRIRHFMIARLRAVGNDTWRRIPDPGDEDVYVLNERWLTHYEWAEGACFRKTPPTWVDFSDELALQRLRIQDALNYARSVGPLVTLRSLALRLKRGSLRRP